MGGVDEGVKVLVGGAWVNVCEGVRVAVGSAVREGIGVAVKRGVRLTIGASVAVAGSGSTDAGLQAPAASPSIHPSRATRPDIDRIIRTAAAC
jgi:hypothetical protein